MFAAHIHYFSATDWPFLCYSAAGLVSSWYSLVPGVIKFWGPPWKWGPRVPIFPGEWEPLWENGDPYCLTSPTGGTDCGVFSIAAAYSAALGIKPHLVTFDADEMRRHLEWCFENEKLTPFSSTKMPVQKCRGKHVFIHVYCVCGLPKSYDTVNNAKSGSTLSAWSLWLNQTPGSAHSVCDSST